MRCTRIEFKGYRRLADTATNIDGEITAFVGTNEAGKTSMLRALEWLTEGDSLSPVDVNRSRPPMDSASPVVTAYFALNDEDKGLFADIEMDGQPTTLTVGRASDGNVTYALLPRPSRVARPFADALRRLQKAQEQLRAEFERTVEEGKYDASDSAQRLHASLAEPEGDWSEADINALDELSHWLGQPRRAGRSRKPRDEDLGALLIKLWSIVREEHPADVAAERLRPHIPSFVVFEEANRVLHTDYELSGDVNRRPPPALRDLLLIADVNLDELKRFVDTNDTTRRESLIDNGNERLLAFFSQAWNQEKITVRLNVDGTRLQLLVKELRDLGPVTDIEERSDGLQTFVALAAFLASGGYGVPPILLLDEAETHLHYNAQADLVGVLLKNVDATQVFYTTHSPHCLPSDLGTGIRLLARDPRHQDASIIKNNFWQDGEPGFAPLLYAMGAGAAAFSVCRKAVLAEGPADMILLPSLIRQATKATDLEYQVAPGLAAASAFKVTSDEVAAKVLYLTDGDAEGDRYKQDLREVGVAARRIFQLPSGCAAEDLVRREDYIDVVNRLLTEMSVRNVTAADLDGSKTISKALIDWADDNKLRLPSKVEIAYALLRREDLRLTAKGREALRRLHERFCSAFAERAGEGR